MVKLLFLSGILLKINFDDKIMIILRACVINKLRVGGGRAVSYDHKKMCSSCIYQLHASMKCSGFQCWLFFYQRKLQLYFLYNIAEISDSTIEEKTDKKLYFLCCQVLVKKTERMFLKNNFVLVIFSFVMFEKF